MILTSDLFVLSIRAQESLSLIARPHSYAACRFPLCRGRGRGAALAPGGGRGGGGGEPRVARRLDNRPTTVKVSGLPASAGEGDLRVHANMAGVVVAAAMLDRPGEGVVKFAERW